MARAEAGDGGTGVRCHDPLAPAGAWPAVADRGGGDGHPGRRFWRPSTTTRSPARMPVTTASVPALASTWTVRMAALLSGSATKTTLPRAPWTMAAWGTTMAPGRVWRAIFTVTKAPGHSTWSLLANRAFAFTVPDSGSTVKSRAVAGTRV